MALPYQNRFKRVSHRSPYTTQPICIREKEIAKRYHIMARAPSDEGRANTWMAPRLLSNASGRSAMLTRRNVHVTSDADIASHLLRDLLSGRRLTRRVLSISSIEHFVGRS